MECLVPGANIKVMSRAIQALAKVTDELHIEAEENSLSFISTNTTRTAYAKYTFQSSFFSSISVGETDSQEKISCKVPMKSLLKIFKFKPHKEKKIELLKIELLPDPSSIIFKFRYKHDTNVVHRINLIDLESISISYKQTNTENFITGPGHLFMRILASLQANDAEINAEILKEKAILRNYDATSSLNVQKCVRSQMTLTSREFTNYDIQNESRLTFSLKAFQSAIHFADVFNIHITWHLDTPGRPTVISMKNPTFEAMYIIATAHADGCSQSTDISTVELNQNHSHSTLNKENLSANVEASKAKTTTSFNNILNNLVQKNFPELQKNREPSPANTSMACNDNLSQSLLAEFDATRSCLQSPTSHNSFLEPPSAANERIRRVFKVCFEDTLTPSMALLNNGTIWAPNSDTESD